jgi:phosphohistidine phosphatase
MDLILWRHADAEDGFVDAERRLTAKGMKQAARVAKWLQKRLPADARIIVSPARRAQQTAMALSEEFRTVKDVGTGATADQVLAAAGWPEARAVVIVVGHQPVLGEIAARLMTGKTADWNIKKGAIWWFTVRDTGNKAQLRAVISPDVL